MVQQVRRGLAISPPLRNKIKVTIGIHPKTSNALDHLIEADPAVKELISPWVAWRLSNLSLIAEYLHQLNRLHPWTEKASLEALIQKEEFSQELKARFGDRWDMTDESVGQQPTLDQLVDPNDEKFEYPTHKNPNEQVVTAGRQVEANLDRFWEKFNLRVQTSHGQRFQDLVADSLDPNRSIYRTPAWGEPSPTEPWIEPSPTEA
ncbi:hypothetical protein BU23DRAFT_573415 [Bimuria novae-zelandiae CBS 107.79]|uniref:Uncharacterized protein n=1 Tax=Bimuria novae-zelandiae CBS 107.79 TaxID=1447943 RepID=A0A6A5URC1_9PLEO|nr:hypothetical protein BU23DRAFT_573415 [Bimuria novae-zelandiae CBS 107.79]